MDAEQYEECECPYCGAPNSLPVDVTGGRNQQFVVDCETCCAPILVRVSMSGGEVERVDVRKENE